MRPIWLLRLNVQESRICHVHLAQLLLHCLHYVPICTIGAGCVVDDVWAYNDGQSPPCAPVVLVSRSLVTVLLGAVMMFLTSWKLALLTVATLPFMLLQFRAFASECLSDTATTFMWDST